MGSCDVSPCAVGGAQCRTGFELRKAPQVAQEGSLRSDDCAMVSTVTASRGVQYLAQAAGSNGNLRCHVIRQQLGDDCRIDFSIVVENETNAEAQARAYVTDALGGGDRTIVQTVVGPGSKFSTTTALEVAPSGLSPELRIALTSGETQFTLVMPSLQTEFAPPSAAEPVGDGALAVPARMPPLTPPAVSPLVRTVAAQPPPYFTSPPIIMQPVRARSASAVMPILLFLVALMAVAAVFAFRPRIAELHVPDSTPAGTAVVVSYEASGPGDLDYAVFGPDGRTVAHGPLLLGAGGFPLTFPPAQAALAYLVRLRVANPLTSAVAEGYIQVPGAPPPATPRPKRAARGPVAPPQIRSQALDRATLAGGDTLTVFYDVLASSGSDALYDPAAQITYEKSALAASGRSTFIVPRVETERFFTVVVSAQRGTATTQSRIGVSVTPADATPAPDAGAAPEALAPDDGSLGAGNGTLSSGTGPATTIAAPPTVHSGRPIRVRIYAAGAGLQLVLLDGSGAELARRDVSAGQAGVDFTAPAVRVPTRFLIEATYPHGVGSETIVRAIAVTP